MDNSRVHLVNHEQMAEVVGDEISRWQLLTDWYNQGTGWHSHVLPSKEDKAWAVITINGEMDGAKKPEGISHWGVTMRALSDLVDSGVADIFILTDGDIFEIGEDTEVPILLGELLEWYTAFGIFAPRECKIPLTKDLMNDYITKYYTGA